MEKHLFYFVRKLLVILLLICGTLPVYAQCVRVRQSRKITRKCGVSRRCYTNRVRTCRSVTGVRRTGRSCRSYSCGFPAYRKSPGKLQYPGRSQYQKKRYSVNNGQNNISRQKTKQQIYTAQNGQCRLCGKHKPLNEMNMVNIVPYSENGKRKAGATAQVLCNLCCSE